MKPVSKSTANDPSVKEDLDTVQVVIDELRKDFRHANAYDAEDLAAKSKAAQSLLEAIRLKNQLKRTI